jgi:hypothetical protein
MLLWVDVYYSLARRKAPWVSVFSSAFLLKPSCINTLRFKNDRLYRHKQVAAEPSKHILAALGSFGYAL